MLLQLTTTWVQFWGSCISILHYFIHHYISEAKYLTFSIYLKRGYLYKLRFFPPRKTRHQLIKYDAFLDFYLWSSIFTLSHFYSYSSWRSDLPQTLQVNHMIWPPTGHQSIFIGLVYILMRLCIMKQGLLWGHCWWKTKDRISLVSVQTRLKRHVTSFLCG